MINFEDGVLVSPAKVNEDGTITPAQYSGKTPLSAYNLNKMQKLTECITGKSISTTTIEGACKIKKVHGDLQQETSTQGKNICPTDISYWESGHYGTTGVKEDNVARIRLKKLLKVEPNNTYYLSTNFENYLFVIRTYDSTGTFVGSIGAVQNGISFTTGATVNYLSIAIYKAGANMNDETYDKFKSYFENGSLKPFICLNSVTDKTYEEFSPNSPSPDYPSEIRVVGDNINLFDKSTVARKGYSSGTVGSEISKITSTTRLLTDEEITVKANTTYTFSLGTTKTLRYNIFEIDENNTILNVISVTNNSDKTFTTNVNTKKMSVMILWQTTTDEIILEDIVDCKIKLEKSTVATGYTSYGIGGIYYKSANKNLLPYPFLNTTRTTNGITFTDNGDGTITANGTATANAFFNLSLPTLSAGTYTLSGIPSGGSGSTYFICLGTANFMKDSSFELSKETTYTTCYIRISSGVTVNNLVFKPMLEQGSVATEYVEHQGKDVVIELPQGEFMAKIGDVEEYIDNKGILHKHIGKKVLDGTETWNMVDNTNYSSDILRFTSLIDGANIVMSSSTSSATLSSNMFTCSYLPTSYDKECIAPHISIINQVNILIDKSRLTDTTVEDFKSWLAEQYSNGTPVEIYYVLATPYEVDLDYNNILPQYEEQTNITCSATSEIEFANSPAIASVNETFDKIQDETVAISSDCPNNKNLWIQKNDNLISKLKVNDIDTATGLEVEYNGFVITQDYIPVESNTNYYAEYVSNSSSGKQIVIYEYDNNHNYLNYHHINDKTYHFSTNSNSAYVKIRFMETNININANLRKGDQKIWTKNNGMYEEFLNADEIISNQFKRNDRYSSTDFNNFTKNGFYMINVQNCTNAPNPYATGMLLVFGGFYISQLFIADLSGTTVGYMRMSSDKGNTWNAWSQITTN